MPYRFPRNRYIPANAQLTLAMRYRSALKQHPFLLFGLPFLTVIVGGSFLLTPVAAIRYERHDRKVRQMSKEEELGLAQGQRSRRSSTADGDGEGRRRRFDMKEEYYRLAAKDIDDWENKRVERFKGEPDGVL